MHELLSRYSQVMATLFNVAFFAMVIVSGSVGNAYGAQENKDIRVLIDISGSMKKNDPKNLRIPAVNLLTELVPEGAQAGVWTFGQYVNMLVKHGKVDDAWRKMAKEKAQQINSVALFTNIGAALTTASDDFYKNADFKNTHFILLTDGMVDIDQDPKKNEAERARILGEIVSRFKEKGAVIHTVGLSENADKSFLERLSVATGGTTEIAETSQDLTRIFTRVLDQAVPAEQVPLEGKSFDIDSSVEELTALIFTKPGSAPTRLVSPDEQVYDEKNHPEFVKWFSDTGYELITVKQPFEGTWTIDADFLPDTRVTVVSNLQLKVNRLPTNFFAGDVLEVQVHFEEDGTKITSNDFLKLLDVDLNIVREDGKSGTKRISDPKNPPADGVFREEISKLSRVGQYEVNVLVDGKTFKRKNRQIINLRSPLNIELSVAPKPVETDADSYLLTITPMDEKIDVEQTKVAIRITAPDGTSEIVAMPHDEGGRAWVLPVRATKGDGTYKIDIKVKGVSQGGQSFKFAPRSVDAVFPIEPGAAVYAKVPEPEGQGAQDQLPENPPEPEPVEEAPEPPEQEIAPPIAVPEVLEEELPVEAPPEDDNLVLYISLGIGGVALLALAGLGVWMLKRRKSKASEAEEDLLGLDDLEVDDTPIEELAAAPTEAMDEPMDEPPEFEEEKLADLDDELDFVEEEPAVPELNEPVEDAPEETETNELPVEEAPEPLDDDVPEEPETTPEELDAILGDLIDDDNDGHAMAEPSPEPDEAEIPELDEPAETEDSQDEEDEEEFNLEDFDISETDDLPVDDEEKK